MYVKMNPLFSMLKLRRIVNYGRFHVFRFSGFILLFPASRPHYHSTTDKLNSNFTESIRLFQAETKLGVLNEFARLEILWNFESKRCVTQLHWFQSYNFTAIAVRKIT